MSVQLWEVFFAVMVEGESCSSQLCFLNHHKKPHLFLPLGEIPFHRQLQNVSIRSEGGTELLE